LWIYISGSKGTIIPIFTHLYSFLSGASPMVATGVLHLLFTGAGQ
jgi:hypothetical protein